MIRVTLPFHLRNLAGIDGEVEVALAPGATATIGAVLDAVEALHPVLRGTIRDHGTLARRPFLRYFCCKQDLSLAPADAPLPAAAAAPSAGFAVGDWIRGFMDFAGNQ